MSDSAIRSPKPNASLNNQLKSATSARKSSKNNDLDGMPTRKDENGTKLPAWKLRELMKSQNHSSSVSSHPTRSVRPVSRTPLCLPGSKAGLDDPSLPPAFRAAFTKQQQRKQNKDVDDFMSLDSVHSGKNSLVARTPTTANVDSDSFDSDDDDSFGGHDSFASLGEGSDDDEAYRESKNQLARQELEGKRANSASKRGSMESRFKKVAKGVHGTPLDFIAE
ncbi:hypothetical protein IV203_006190 [Nitzschia inconspicua]|uniref:Uncharacterized protein n=1 Tax=Nitzschia inconspicua TaxID=303405 RepID=A0A9K3KPM8_9STRA|nr:hypothetical protein IV203_006190 [Nitzschia inconspicua]